MSTATSPASQTAAVNLLSNNATIDSAIASIINQIQAAQSSITEARPAISDLKETLGSHLQKIATLKGKGAWYPYVGSGIGNGPLVELCDGSVKWDLINGIGVHMFGHSDPQLIETAIRASLSDTCMQGNLQYNEDAIAFADLLVSEAAKNSRIRHIFTINSGALANETALKICMQKKDGKANRIIAFKDCFMGRTTTMCQIGDSAGGRDGIPLNINVDYMPFYNPEHGERAIDIAIWHLKDYFARYPGRHACFAMELVQGEGGFNTAPREFFTAIMECCKEHDVPVWLDEVQTFGRTTEMFHFDALNLGEYVDVVTIGKMSQVCACLYTEELNPKPGLLSATFIGSTTALNVGRHILERLRDGGFYGSDGKIAKLHDAYRELLNQFVTNHQEWFPKVVDPATGRELTKHEPVGGVGGMMRFTPFGGEKKKIMDSCHALFDEGIICFACGHGPWHLRFLPPVGIMQPGDFDKILPILEKGLARVA